MGHQVESNLGETKNHPRYRHHRMKLKSDEEKPFKCRGCKELGSGPRYRCVKNNCEFVLHELCFTARPEDLPITHQFTGNSGFQFRWTPPPAGQNRPRLCHACEREVQGFLLYRVQSGHKHYFHPCCMILERTICDPSSGMTLTLKDKVPSNSRCVKCEKKDLKVPSKGPFRSGWSYVSSCGNYCYHVYCVMKFMEDNWERSYLGVVASSYNNNNSLSSRGRSLVRGETTASSSSRSRSVQSGHRSSIASARRGWSLPPIPSPARRFFIRLAKSGLCYLTAKLLEPKDPIPLFREFARVLDI